MEPDDAPEQTELDERDAAYYEQEFGPPADEAVVHDLGDALIHAEFALAALERLPVDWYPIGFEWVVENLYDARNTLQRLMSEGINQLDQPETVFVKDVIEEGPCGHPGAGRVHLTPEQFIDLLGAEYREHQARAERERQQREEWEEALKPDPYEKYHTVTPRDDIL